jgi:hypothetical protein
MLQVAVGVGRPLVAYAAPASSINSISVSATCGSAGGFTGTVALNGTFTGTVELGLFYHVPGSSTFIDSGLRADAPFSGGNVATYNFPAFTFPGANTYRIQVVNSAGLGGATEKSNSVPPCTGTPPPQCTGTGATGPSFLGLCTPGQNIDTTDDNSLSGSQITVGSSNETVSSICAGVGPLDTTPGNNKFGVAIYTDVNGAPGSLVAFNGNGILTVANGFNCLSITAALAAGQSYWLEYNSNGNDKGANPFLNDLTYNDAASPMGGYSSPVTFGTWPSTFPNFTAELRQYAIYANVTP